MHLHVSFLANAKGSVRRLIFNRRIPPAVEVKNVIGGSEIQARSPGFERKEKDARTITVFTLESFDHAVAFGLGDCAVQKEDLPSEGLLQMRLDERAHLGKLREDQGPIAFGQRLFEHLGQTRELA